MNTVSFEDRVVIVTGAGGALGRAYALDIARRGGAVVVNDPGSSVQGEGHSREVADAVVDEIRAAGGRAIASHDGVDSVEGARRIAGAAIATFGKVDALVNNAGNMRFGEFASVSAEDLASLLAVHLVGTFNITQAVWPHMKSRGYGRVVFTSSAAGMLGNPNMSAYGAAKGGISGLMNVLAQEGRAHGILCNALLPNAMSRMGAAVAASGTMPRNPWFIEEFLPTMDPSFTTGIAVYLASEACQTDHSLYSCLGGRIARTFIGVSEGWYGSRTTPATADDVAANIDAIRDTSRGFDIPESLQDEFRLVAQRVRSGRGSADAG